MYLLPFDLVMVVHLLRQDGKGQCDVSSVYTLVGGVFFI